jgi:hypothetical protein
MPTFFVSRSITPQDVVQLITLILACVVLFYEYKWRRLHPDKLYYSEPTVWVLIHHIVYYVCVLFLYNITVIHEFKDMSVPLLFSYWSAILRLHTVIFFGIMVYGRLKYDQKPLSITKPLQILKDKVDQQ